MAHPYSFETYYTNKVQVIKPFLTTVGALIKKKVAQARPSFFSQWLTPSVFTMTQAHFHLRVASDLCVTHSLNSE